MQLQFPNVKHKFAPMIYQLNERLVFPNPEEAEPDGLLAVGGDLAARYRDNSTTDDACL